jgi:ribosomal-protein-alanine N-acetyltransferase
MRKFSGRAGPAMGVKSGYTPAGASVRRFRPEDVDEVMAIAAASPEVASWSRASYLKFVEENGSLSLVLNVNGEISGFFVGRRIGDQSEVLNLAVRAKHRRKGEGSALLQLALEEIASGGGKTVYLEVRESNTGAISFYEKQGFSKTGLRKAYYRNPDEAAVTMEKKLAG